MATPMTANQFLAALKAEGVRLIEVSGWKTHNRDDETGKPFGPVYGIVNHHTASNDTPTSLIRNGNSALPGPRAMGHLKRDGIVRLVGYGRCNHAGLGDKDVLAAMKADVKAPAPNHDDVDFNDCTYSLECDGTNDGKPFTDAQIDTMVRFNTAICRFHGWKKYSAVGHRSITLRKPYDPSGIAVTRLQDLVELRLKYPANTPSVAGVAKPAAPPAPLAPATLDKVTLIEAPGGSRYHLTPKGLVWLPTGTTILGPSVNIVKTDLATWRRYRTLYPN